MRDNNLSLKNLKIFAQILDIFADLNKITSGWNYFWGWNIQPGQIIRLKGLRLEFEPEDVIGMSERMSEEMLTEMSENMSEDMTEKMQKRMSEDMPEDTRERMWEDMPERTLEDTPQKERQKKCQIEPFQAHGAQAPGDWRNHRYIERFVLNSRRLGAVATTILASGSSRQVIRLARWMTVVTAGPPTRRSILSSSSSPDFSTKNVRIWDKCNNMMSRWGSL